MKITGKMLLGQSEQQGSYEKIYAINPVTGEQMAPVFRGGDQQQVEEACALADAAFDSYRCISAEQRAAFLEQIADNILALEDSLLERAMAETGLPRGRIEGERGRTIGQLRLFAGVVREGRGFFPRIDPALPERQPLPRSDLRQRHIPLGPVAVFGASNFPLAFSVAGGDTASALAAGAPVVVKAHSAHPGTSELVGRAIQLAVKQCQLHPGVFSLLYGSGTRVGTGLVNDARIKAVGFTGSRTGGTALMKAAFERPEPIPVYAEMSSANPVFLLPAALASDPVALATGFCGSLQAGAGQFCTNPGLVIAVDGQPLQQFIEECCALLSQSSSQTMLTSDIHQAYVRGVERMVQTVGVDVLSKGQCQTGPNQCQTVLLATSAETFFANKGLSEEVFGSCSLVVRCRDEEQMLKVAGELEGQLTTSVQCHDNEQEQLVSSLLKLCELKAGRVLFNGYPTGVEVCHAMVHGGPYPATSESRSTSVGTAAIQRFLRPVCYQDVPEKYLPVEIDSANTGELTRLVNGVLSCS
ncbi:aldehyde dehydrogenase (NADP(+)) [Aliamphritea hakodatensis]|uniref:aldehyde dehydrogenase (NADP(+)) n=1 Tax=Aliamphritea hakodatensis TaxID=2895352 RepID=UPI0022FD9087|nr:aldehyde dehydrogenase (NADP(+)) [Aliamphritea hakodatensis]